MEKRSKRRLDYTAGYDQKDGVVLPKIKSKMVVSNFTKRYSNNLYLLAELRPASRLLLDYLSECMSAENVVHTTATARQEFITFLAFVTKNKTVLSDVTVKKAIGQLSKFGFLVPINRGSMMVNPEYFFKGNEEDRMRLIKELYESNLVVPSLDDMVEPPKPQPTPSSQFSSDDFDYDEMIRQIENA